MLTDPELGRSSPAINPSKVLLPEPEAPTIASASPEATVNEISCKMLRLVSPLGTSLHKSATSIATLVSIPPVFSVMLKSLIVALLMFVSATAGSVEAASKVILVYGDSLSAGYGIRVEQSWPSLLGDRLKEDTRVGAGGTPSWTVANASISGETTAGGRSRLEVALRQFKPKVVVLALGANDGLRGLPVKQMQDNLISMVKLAKASGARVLLIGMRLPPNYGPEYTNAFEAAFTTTARLEKVALLPFLLEPVAGQRSNFQADGLHPISAAQTKLLDHIYPALQPLLK
uniref:SGNH hydrolase-type esterase domain-containing protein n=1 Tax=uncultured organism TaxID=155900 RepID=A0A0G3FEH2_9ZZZZ|nr:hypothetical protein [uncultured organism]